MGRRSVASTSLVVVFVIVIAILVPSLGVATAHLGHSHGDGRIPGEPDFKRIGEMEFSFHPKARAYTLKPTPTGPPQWVHFDNFAAAPGAELPLPASQEAFACASSGHRIRVAYSSLASPAVPTSAEREAITNIVQRMTWKISQEALRSSANSRFRVMRVDCDPNLGIHIYTFTSSGAGYPEIAASAKAGLGEPTGADSVKNLVFFDGQHPDNPGEPGSGIWVGGVGGIYDDTLKSSADTLSSSNDNRVRTNSAVVYNPPIFGPLGYWDTHVPIHELTHTMGGVQKTAPFATANHHCTDGIDILCYPDAPGVPYSETRCPANGYYNTSDGTPLDCQYDSYFDALEESGEFLSSAWNVGGTENPFLPQPDYRMTDLHAAGGAHYAVNVIGKQPTDIPIAGDWNGDGTVTTGFYRPSTATWYLRNSHFSGPPDLVFEFGLKNVRPVIGDWDGNGTDTIGSFSPGSGGLFYIRNSNSAGVATTISFGSPEDLPVAGDWDGNGTETIGTFRPSNGSFYLRNENAPGVPAYTFGFGNSGSDDLPVAGDWDGSGSDSVGVYRQSIGFWFLDNQLPADQPVSYEHGFGVTGHAVPIVGDWNNSDSDTAGAAWK